MEYCIKCELRKDIKAFGICTSCYRKDYYNRNKQTEIDRAIHWNQDNKDHYNAQSRKTYLKRKDFKTYVNKRCPNCNKQITVNKNKTTVKCSCCGAGFTIRKTLSISNKNKHGIKLVHMC